MKNKRKLGIVTGIVAGVILLVLVGFVVFLGMYYKNRWYPGTVINGIDVSKQTLEESKRRLEDSFRDYALTVRAREDGELTVRGEDIGFTVNPGTEWEELFGRQHNSFVLLVRDKEYTLEYDVSYDEKKLKDELAQSELVSGSDGYKIQKPVAAYAKYNDDRKQYAVVSEVQGNQLESAAFETAVKDALQQARISIDITDGGKYPGIYKAPAITADDAALKKEVALCNNAALRFITWNMGEGVTEQIGPKTIAKWITYKNGKVKYDDAALTKWVEKFCLKYKTVGKTRTILSYAGTTADSSTAANNQTKNKNQKKEKPPKPKKVKVPGGDYGWQIDYDKTLKQARDALNKKIKSSLTDAYIADPGSANKKALTMKQKVNYLNTAFKKDYENFSEDWDTENYTEVSLTEQMVYVIRKGKLAFSCRCITGRPVKGRITTTGAFFIKEHRKNYTMKGADYQTFVKLWVRITWTGTGFHPATWQPWSRWSKTLYQTRGSHGCINLSPSDAETIYNMVKYREAVFLHY